MAHVPPPTYEQAMGNGNRQQPPQTIYISPGTPNPPGFINNNEVPVVIIQQQTVLPLPLGPEPILITCPTCHRSQRTRIEYEPSSRTHFMALFLCLIGLWCCFCLPYCAGSCMNVNHYCANCNHYLGTYKSTF